MDDSFVESLDVSKDSVKVEQSVLKFSGMQNSSDVLTTQLPTMFQNDLDATKRLMSTMSPSVKRVLEASRDPIISRLSERTSLDFLAPEKVLPINELPVEPKQPIVSPTKSTTHVKKTPTDKPLSKVVSDVWGGVRRLLGLKKVECKNGGKAIGDSCNCPKYFEGQYCESRVCINGELTKSTVLPITYECKCSDPLYIEGVHCEVVKCSNRAPLITFENGTSACNCSDSYFYSGRYCERFEASYAVAGIALFGLLLLIICCGLCRIDWCPRRRNRRSRNGQRHSDSARVRGRDSDGRLPSGSRLVSGGQAQEFLLPRNPICNRGGDSHVRSNQGPPFIIRLDTIPTFNPDMIGGVEPDKPMEPPPSYDQALSAPTAPEPPRYSETDDSHSQATYRHPSAPR